MEGAGRTLIAIYDRFYKNTICWLCTHGFADPEKCTALPNSVAIRKRLKKQILHVHDANRWISAKLRRKETGFQYLQTHKLYERVWMRAIVSSWCLTITNLKTFRHWIWIYSLCRIWNLMRKYLDKKVPTWRIKLICICCRLTDRTCHQENKGNQHLLDY